jgi:hypothetical protein
MTMSHQFTNLGQPAIGPNLVNLPSTILNSLLAPEMILWTVLILLLVGIILIFYKLDLGHRYT